MSESDTAGILKSYDYQGIDFNNEEWCTFIFRMGALTSEILTFSCEDFFVPKIQRVL